MINWNDPAEIVKDAGVFQKFCLVLLGLTAWEVVTQLPFDWSMITGRREARWPLFFYAYCKYSLFFAVIGVNISLNITTEVNCQSLYVFNQFAGNTAIGSASTLLMLRTMAIWSRKLFIVIPLVICSLAQWGILFHGVATVKSVWSPAAATCAVLDSDPKFISLIYLYTMSFDLIVLILSVIGLVSSPGGRSSLWSLLFTQGVVYFLVAFLSNLIPATFLLLNLNPIMNIMFAIPAAVASSIVACRSFVSLTDYKPKDVYVHSAQPYGTNGTRGTRVAGSRGNKKNVSMIASGVDTTGMHISMDDFSSHPTYTVDPRAIGTISSTTLELERNGTKMSKHGHDLESGDDESFDKSGARSFPPEV